MNPKLLVMMLLGTSLLAETHVSIGIGIGTPMYYPPPPPVIAYAPPPCPGPGYLWIAGYWYPAGARYSWHAGYWARPPYAGAYWVAPRYYGQRYYPGYWGRAERHAYGNYGVRWNREQHRGYFVDRWGQRDSYRQPRHGGRRGRGHEKARR